MKTKSKAKVKKTRKKTVSAAKHVSEVPVNRLMLQQVRNELKTQIQAVRYEMKAGFHKLRSEITGVKSEVSGLKSEIEGVKSEVAGVKSEIHRLSFLIEEQNARNSIVMDHMVSLFGRQERVEQDVAEIRSFMLSAKIPMKTRE